MDETDPVETAARAGRENTARNAVLSETFDRLARVARDDPTFGAAVTADPTFVPGLERFKASLRHLADCVRTARKAIAKAAGAD